MDDRVIERITRPEDVSRLLDPGHGPVLLFKHSTQCPVSTRAHEAFLAYVPGAHERGLTLALVRVIEERPLSQDIERRTGVPHASPQALLLRGGQVVWHASHGAITVAALEAAEAAA